MARESAHQLGTPLSSLAGWIELLEDEAEDDATRRAVGFMRADLERLDRVAHRFERIGREPRRDAVDVAELVDRIAAYFRARVPKLSHAVTIDVVPPGTAVDVRGDAVLLEWALEVLVKNAIDALAGRGGVITLAAEPRGRRAARASASPTTDPASPASCAVASSSPASRRRRADGGSDSRSRAASSRRITAARCSSPPSDRGAAFEIILP